MYCYNIFLIHPINSQVNQWNEIKIKLLVLFLLNGIGEWSELWAASSIEELHSSNYGVVGYGFPAISLTTFTQSIQPLFHLSFKTTNLIPLFGLFAWR